MKQADNTRLAGLVEHLKQAGLRTSSTSRFGEDIVRRASLAAAHEIESGKAQDGVVELTLKIVIKPVSPISMPGPLEDLCYVIAASGGGNFWSEYIKCLAPKPPSENP